TFAPLSKVIWAHPADNSNRRPAASPSPGAGEELASFHRTPADSVRIAATGVERDCGVCCKLSAMIAMVTTPIARLAAAAQKRVPILRVSAFWIDRDWRYPEMAIGADGFQAREA